MKRRTPVVRSGVGQARCACLRECARVPSKDSPTYLLYADMAGRNTSVGMPPRQERANDAETVRPDPVDQTGIPGSGRRPAAPRRRRPRCVRIPTQASPGRPAPLHAQASVISLVSCAAACRAAGGAVFRNVRKASRRLGGRKRTSPAPLSPSGRAILPRRASLRRDFPSASNHRSGSIGSRLQPPEIAIPKFRHDLGSRAGATGHVDRLRRFGIEQSFMPTPSSSRWAATVGNHSPGTRPPQLRRARRYQLMRTLAPSAAPSNDAAAARYPPVLMRRQDVALPAGQIELLVGAERVAGTVGVEAASRRCRCAPDAQPGRAATDGLAPSRIQKRMKHHRASADSAGCGHARTGGDSGAM